MKIPSLTLLSPQEKKKKKEPQINIKQQQQQKRGPISSFLLKNLLILVTSIPSYPHGLRQMFTHAQYQEEEGGNEKPEYFYCKLNLLGSPRMLSVKPTSDFLSEERNIYDAVFIL